MPARTLFLDARHRVVPLAEATWAVERVTTKGGSTVRETWHLLQAPGAGRTAGGRRRGRA